MNITDRFIRGLKKYNVTQEEITSGSWKYVGGDTGRHLNYYRVVFRDKELPGKKTKCICDHIIRENCYIRNRDSDILLVLGNCCIKRFLPANKAKRTCEICNKTHRNRIVNRCNQCRKGLCDKCSCIIPIKYRKCIKCHFSNVHCNKNIQCN